MDKRPKHPPSEPELQATDPSRRSLFSGMTAAVARLAVAAGETATRSPDDLLEVSFRLNGEPVRAAVDMRRTLLDYLREEVCLTGTKVGCRHGQCGTCTVRIAPRSSAQSVIRLRPDSGFRNRLS